MGESSDRPVMQAWLIHAMEVLIGAMALTGVAWMRATSDQHSADLSRLMDRVAVLEALQNRDEAQLRQAQQDVQALQSTTNLTNDNARALGARLDKLDVQVDDQQKWIEAQIYADEAQRELDGIKVRGHGKSH
jgi:hypothetical protein